MNSLMTLVGIIAALVALDVAAFLWGADSQDGVNSVEWERRRGWKGFR